MTGKNPLLLPLVAVSALALVEAVMVGVLWVRDRPPPVAVGAQAAPADTRRDAATSGAPAAAASSPGTAAGAGTANGKVGERVESAGLAVTAIGISNQPTGPGKGLVSITPDERYLDIDVVIENSTGRPFKYWPLEFRLKDDGNYDYSQNALRVNPAALQSGTLVQGEKVRGHLEFTVPKTAKGLRLIYPTADLPGYKPIHIELGQ
jgi:hypothetical protein